MIEQAKQAWRVAARVLMRPELPLAGLVAIGLGFRLWRAWQDIPTLLRKVTADDAYYYFAIARNISNGHNVTFDGETLTNGFHPLWLALVTPVYFFTDDLELGVHWSLTIGAVLGSAAIVFVYLIGRELTGNGWASLAGAGFFALHPYVVVDSVNGMETPVAVLMLSITIWLFARIARCDSKQLRDYALLGVATGLMLLARTDAIFVAGAIGLFLAVSELRRQVLDRFAIFCVGAIVVLTPWLVWNLLTFGTIVQVSGEAIPDLTHSIYEHKNGDAFDTQADAAWRFTKGALTDSLVRQYFVFPFAEGRWAFLIALGAGLGAVLVAPFSPQRGRVTRQIAILAVPAAGVFAMLIYHAAFRWVLREWYYAPFPLIASALLTIGVAYVHSLLQGTRLSLRDNPVVPAKSESSPARNALSMAAILAIVAVGILTFYGPAQAERWVDKRSLGHRVNLLEGARWLEENTAEDARIGSFNSGIIGYFSDRTVVNLDGVVNEDAYRARLDCDISDYMVEKNIRYLAELEARDELPRIDGLSTLPCGERPCLSGTLLAKLGRLLPYFGGAQVDVLELTPIRRPGCPGGASALFPADEEKTGPPIFRTGLRE